MKRKRYFSKNSSAAIIGANKDLLIQILLFLPAESLFPLKTVSKRWRRIISARSFSRLHTVHHSRRLESQCSFILSRTTSQFFICNPTATRLVPFGFPFPHVRILQSCNGLLLLDCRNSPRAHSEYHVFNPTTKKSRDLRIRSVYSGLYLIFDPSKSRHYRVVCFMSGGNSTSFRVFYSETGKWKNIDDAVTGRYNFRNGVYWTGSIYFINYCSEASFCYFLEDNIYHVPNPPRSEYSTRTKNYIMESNGHLHFLRLTLREVKKVSYIYEMIDDQWLKSADICENCPLSGGNGAKRTQMDLIGMIRGEKMEDSKLLYHVPGKIMIYRFLDGVEEVLFNFKREYFYQRGRLQFGFKDSHPFVYSLAPV